MKRRVKLKTFTRGGFYQPKELDIMVGNNVWLFSHDVDSDTELKNKTTKDLMNDFLDDDEFFDISKKFCKLSYKNAYDRVAWSLPISHYAWQSLEDFSTVNDILQTIVDAFDEIDEIGAEDRKAIHNFTKDFNVTFRNAYEYVVTEFLARTLDTLSGDDNDSIEKAKKADELIDKMCNNKDFNKIYRRLTTYTYVTNTISSWAKSSSVGAFAAAIQLAAKDEFRLDDSATEYFEEQRADSSQNNFYFSNNHMTQMRKLLRAMYNRTQEHLKKLFPDGFVLLFRGAQFESEELYMKYHKHGIKNEKGYGFGILQTNPIASYSLEKGIAEGFATSGDFDANSKFIHFGFVPINRILSTPFTGFGCLGEKEFVVLGNKQWWPLAYDDEAYSLEFDHMSRVLIKFENRIFGNKGGEESST